MNNRLIIILMSTLLLVTCSKEPKTDDVSQTKSVSLNLSINTLSVADPLSINKDETFASLAIYLYNNDSNFTLDKSALLPSFASISTKDIPIQTQIGTKILYLIANYTGKTFKLTNGLSLTLSPTTTKQQLDNIITESSSGFAPNTLLMVGKQTLAVTLANNGTTIGVDLRRLQSRIDVHIYKGANFGSNIVTLESITFNNQVLNSEVKFDYTVNSAQMLSTPMLNTQIITNSSLLLPNINGTILQPINSQAIFYSYQNLVATQSPLQATAPYLQITVNSNGVKHTYKGYFTDNNQIINKYSLLQNNIYQITAILNTDSKIALNMVVLPWNKINMEYKRPITANDFSFGPFANSWGGINGKTMNTNTGELEDAVFKFELKSPIGAEWTATLTNGLNFSFATSTAGTTTTAVSKGFTNLGYPYLIAIRAIKKWGGNANDTEFYITVEGEEIPINPIVGTQRVYEGTSTRIKIRQVASYN